MWPFTENFRLSIARAKEEADRLGHRSLDSCHLLLGILSADLQMMEVLARLGLDLYKARLAVEDTVSEQDVGADEEVLFTAASDESMVFTARAKEAIQKATLDVAGAMGDRFVDSKHLLLALIREPQKVGAATQVIKVVNPRADLAQLRLQLGAGTGQFVDREPGRMADLETKVETLENELSELRVIVEALRRKPESSSG